jgi:hypothetical protein
MARWTDKKPPGDITILFEHGMKTVFVAACRTYLELGIHFDLFDFVIHTILLMFEPHAKAQRFEGFFMVKIIILCGLAALREQEIKIDRIPFNYHKLYFSKMRVKIFFNAADIILQLK